MTYEFNEFQTKWLEALESGEYEQTHHALTDGKGYCCLGLLCLTSGETFEATKGSPSFGVRDPENGNDLRTGSLPLHIVRAAKMKSISGDFPGGTLVGMNDNGATFSEIAAFIRSNPTAVFKE